MFERGSSSVQLIMTPTITNTRNSTIINNLHSQIDPKLTGASDWHDASSERRPAQKETSNDERKIASASHDDQSGTAEKMRGVAPVDGGLYGWICVAACATINAHTWGLNSAYAVFLAHYLANNVFPGATPLHYAFIGGLSISQALIVSPVATFTTRVFGTRTTLLIGVAFETISFVGASFATQIWHLFLSQGICFGWGMGFLFVGSVGIAAQWFTTHRSLANGISAAGSGLGGLIYSLSAQSLIKNIGSSQLSFDYRLFKRKEFVGLLAFGFLSMLGYVVLLFSLPNYARTIGLTAQQGSIVGAVLNLGQALGRPPIGYFSDSIGRLNMASSMTFLVGLFSLVIWMFAKSFGVLIFFAFLGGTVAGTYWAVCAPVTTEVVGLVDLPSALSITWLVLVIPTTFSEPIGLEIVAFNNQSYTGAILFTGWMYIGAAVCLWLVRAWKIGEMEESAIEEGKSETDAHLGICSPPEQGSVSRDFRRSPFVKRIFVWRKV
ncbi:hypothetical protein ACN47E_001304 [Coniothyrium glycines]